MNMIDSSKPQLVRALKLRDLVLLNLVAVLGLRHLGGAAKAGPVTLTLWALAAIFLFVPLGLAAIELSSRFPIPAAFTIGLNERSAKSLPSFAAGAIGSTTFFITPACFSQQRQLQAMRLASAEPGCKTI